MDNVMKWLLEDESPQIKYRAMIELQGRTKSDVEVKKTYDDLLDSEILRVVLDKFHDTNKWEHINAFLSIHEFGLTRNDIQIDDYVDRIIKDLNKSMKCAKTLLLRNLVSLCYQEHPWVEAQVKLAFSNIREDGTIHCLDKGKKTNDSKLPDMGCYRQTTTFLLLAAELRKKGIILPQFERISNFFLGHRVVFREDGSEKFIINDMTSTFYSIDHVNIGIQMILYGLSVLGVGNNDSCKAAHKIFERYKNSEGKYVLSHSFYKPYFDVGPIGQSNKWITLYAKLIELYDENKSDLNFEQLRGA